MGASGLAIVAGCALQLQQPRLWDGSAYGAALLAASLALMGLWRLRHLHLVATRSIAPGLLWVLGYAALILASFSLTGWRAAQQASQSLPAALERQDVQVVGVIASMPQQTEAGLRFVMAVETPRPEALALPPRLSVGWYGGVFPRGDGGAVGGTTGVAALAELQRQPPGVKAGERWRMTLRLKAPHGSLNPHGFDYELWMWEQGIGANATVRATARDEPPQRLASTWAYPVEQFRQWVRDGVFERVSDRRLAGVIAALAVGDQRSIDRADWDLFRATGVAHLMSISGLHITMFAWLAVRLAGAAWRRSAVLCLWQPAQRAALVAGCLLAIAYALISGWGLPAQRTVWMLVVVSGLRLLGLRWPWPQVWLAVLALLALLDPWGLLQPGFWLSFVAVGLLFASGAGDPGMASAARASRAWYSTLLVRFLAMVREQWVLTLALAPLTLMLFGQVSLVGLFANLFAIPWVTLCVTPLALAGVLWPALWPVAALAVDALSGMLQGFAAWPWAVWTAPTPAAWASGLAVLAGVWLALRLPWSLRALAVPLLLPALLWQVPRPDAGTFELLALDVGQGNAVLVRTAGHALLYDAGPRYSVEADAGHRVIAPLLRARGERLDLLMLSHSDIDHTGGAPAVLAQQTGARLQSPIPVDHPLSRLRPIDPCERGQRWQWDGVDFEVLYPGARQPAFERRANPWTCVLRVTDRHGRSALLTGDIEQPQEAELLALGVRGPVAWLLVPHHGSKTSSSEAFIDVINPALAVVQAGYANRFGHPAAPVVERYRRRGVPLVNTATCGAMHWRSDAPAQWTSERERSRRYWHHQPVRQP